MSRLDDLKLQNKELNVSLIDVIASLDPTDTYKYTGFLLKCLKNELGNLDVKQEFAERLFSKELIDYLEKFEKHAKANRIKNNDVSKLKSFDDIITEVKAADEIIKLKQIEKQIIKIFEDDDYLLLIPLTFEASKNYGSNTKWCVTQEIHWKNYQWKWRLIYIIDKKGNRKYAISKKYDEPNKIQGWLSDDKETNPMLFPIPEFLFSHIMKFIKMDFFEPELSIIDDFSILTDKGVLLTIKEASIIDIRDFLNKHEKRLNKTHLANLRSALTQKNTFDDKKKSNFSLKDGIYDESNMKRKFYDESNMKREFYDESNMKRDFQISRDYLEYYKKFYIFS